MSKNLATVNTINAAGRDHDSVRSEVHELLGKGKACICPTCDQHAMVNTRKITESMAHQLKRMVEHGGPMASTDIQANTSGTERMYSLLRFWGLIEKHDDKTWEATDLGRQFVAGTVDVPSRLFVYNNAKVGTKGDERTTWEQCLNEPFDLPEVFSTEAQLGGASLDLGPSALAAPPAGEPPVRVFPA